MGNIHSSTIVGRDRVDWKWEVVGVRGRGGSMPRRCASPAVVVWVGIVLILGPVAVVVLLLSLVVVVLLLSLIIAVVLLAVVGR